MTFNVEDVTLYWEKSSSSSSLSSSSSSLSSSSSSRSSSCRSSSSSSRSSSSSSRSSSSSSSDTNLQRLVSYSTYSGKVTTHHGDTAGIVEKYSYESQYDGQGIAAINDLDNHIALASQGSIYDYDYEKRKLFRSLGGVTDSFNPQFYHLQYHLLY